MFSIDLHPGITILQTKERPRGSHVVIFVAHTKRVYALSMRHVYLCLLVFVISTDRKRACTGCSDVVMLPRCFHKRTLCT